MQYSNNGGTMCDGREFILRPVSTFNSFMSYFSFILYSCKGMKKALNVQFRETECCRIRVGKQRLGS